MSEKKLFLLDAFALIYRAYYSLVRSPRVTTTGRNTNAQFGFTTTLLDLINKEKPTHLAVVFDTPSATERHADFADYKANRQEAPEDITAAIPDIKEIVRGFNLPCLELDGYEADDIIGTLALEAAELGYTVFMVTPDKDYGQVVRENVFIYKPGYQGGGVELLGPSEICQKWNIKRVDQVIDMLGLMGDAVDNIPGIPGVGEKTAAKLLAEYNTLENVLDNAEKIKGALGQKITNGKESALMSKKLATIITNVPILFHEENFRVKDLNKEALHDIFQTLEFKALAKRVLNTELSATVQPNIGSTDLFGNPTLNTVKVKTVEANQLHLPEIIESNFSTIATTQHEYKLVQTPNEIEVLVSELIKHSVIAFDTETTNIDAMRAELVGFSFSWKKGNGFYIPSPNQKHEVKELLANFQPLFDRTDICWVGHNIKYDLILLKHYGFSLKGSMYDTMLAHYIIEPEGRRNMDLLSERFLSYKPVSIETLIGSGKAQTSMRDVAIELIKDYAAEDADVTWQLKQCFDPIVEQASVGTILNDVENPLVSVLMDMEYEGVGVDVPFLNHYSIQLEREIKETEERVYTHAGTQFNLGSPKQLGVVLFEKMDLDSTKKTKTGQYATGEDVLQKLKHKHPIIEDILVFRELSKLKNTYVDALPLLIHPQTGRVHTSFNQAVAVTGRLSSTNPNLQNIPIRTDRGREIRKAFISRGKGWKLISADYSQIELRIIAAISGDEGMIADFRAHKDIHTTTAAKVYRVNEAEVSSEMRRAAKAVNFGIIYGQSAFGLAENLGISRSEAKEVIDNYFTEYPAIKSYMDNQIALARETGFVQTLLGRKRWLKDIRSSNQTVRGFAERNAINMPIQGSAADMIKLAMIHVHKELQAAALQTKMILQVHDELIFDVPEQELDQATTIIRKGMQEAMPLPHQVPVVVEVGVGNNWLEAH
ncbi:MAG: DNA polymerase I [Bacteroidetes bacterium]|nr:DNA polymerase I [Bacteroidota bacterium]